MSKVPLPIFDSIRHFTKDSTFNHVDPVYNFLDIRMAAKFLLSYTGALGTFTSYRREVERLIHWSVLIRKKCLKELQRDDIEDFIHFCQKPPKGWVGYSKPPKFIEEKGERIPNPLWKPFIFTVSKSQRKKGTTETNAFEISQGALKGTFMILGSFYTYLVQEQYVLSNPVGLIRQKSKFLRKNQAKPKIRRLSELQWQYVIQTAKKLAEESPEHHERSLFIISALYSMYLRISELVASSRWSPQMNHFYSDSDGNYWFTTVGKGNKQRDIAVSDSMLMALKRWRQYLGLSALPTPADDSALIPKHPSKGNGPLTSAFTIRKIVQVCFDNAAICMVQDGFIEESETLHEATVHWLRHTGISDDVKIRPREHVRDDAGHSSSAITDRYIDVELRERHRSAKRKAMDYGEISRE